MSDLERRRRRLQKAIEEAEHADFDAESCFRVGDFGEAGRAERRSEALWSEVATLRESLGDEATAKQDAVSRDFNEAWRQLPPLPAMDDAELDPFGGLGPDELKRRAAQCRENARITGKHATLQGSGGFSVDAERLDDQEIEWSRRAVAFDALAKSATRSD